MTTISVQRAPHSRAAATDLGAVPFSSVYSDHMVVARFGAGRWDRSEIVPYGPLSIAPNVSALHYGVSVFEGLKAHRSASGDILLFRPWENARRLNRSAARLVMPPVDEAAFLEGLRALVREDARWVPPAGAGALYIRPFLFSVDGSVRVKAAEEFLFVILTFPFGSYFSAPVHLWITEQYVRAFPGGTGDAKVGGNYAPALLADQEARQAGCDTVLWLDGKERAYVEECGVMNVFFVVEDRVLTPALSGTILPGVTRDSVIRLLRDSGVVVEERAIALEEIVRHHGQGTLRECFGTGTATTVSHVQRIRFRDQDLVLPPVEQRTVGPSIRDRLVGIMTGRLPDPYGWVDRV